jgi:abortive infection bacteriophage resistance protein
MPKIPYNKPATTYTEQVEQLKNRGMIFSDEEKAKRYLQHLNYYRLSAYWLPFENDHATHKFRTDTKFDDVLALYIFDRELRLIVLDAIERIEVSARAQWAYCMGHSHGPHSHLDPNLAQDFCLWQKNISSLINETDRSDEIFIKHLKDTYEEPLPAIWAICEVMSLGLLSRWYKNLKPQSTRREIAHVYEIDEDVLASWLHHISVVRNVCAHHSRLWNRKFDRVAPQKTIKKPSILQGQFEPRHKLYNSLVILLYLMDKISPGHSWRPRLKDLLLRNSRWLTDMGFPTNWKARTIWT